MRPNEPKPPDLSTAAGSEQGVVKINRFAGAVFEAGWSRPLSPKSIRHPVACKISKIAVFATPTADDLLDSGRIADSDPMGTEDIRARAACTVAENKRRMDDEANRLLDELSARFEPTIPPAITTPLQPGAAKPIRRIEDRQDCGIKHKNHGQTVSESSDIEAWHQIRMSIKLSYLDGVLGADEY
ncbi:hypothetical protein LTR37_020552 [Vermiconidia calcicola]|uniref:Uncharacterized protein n=1 Tax=Vermiconidia calcicola TaxID=1690605 RepID=A0ACC3MAX5_9PEZI|nr:hypothetical protein LTR37_020552 [Vermiconidia calcicola]